MKRAFWKDLLREIKKSFGRFLAIFSIALLGVAFFAGVCASPYNMQATADQYFDEYCLEDIHLLSTIGFTEGDVEAVRKIDGVQGVYALKSCDVLMKTEDSDKETVMRIQSIPEDLSEGNEDYIGRLRLSSGRLPEKEDEVVIRRSMGGSSLDLGTVIELRSGNEDLLSDSLSVKTVTVVGIVYTPNSISFSTSASSIGNGSVSCEAFMTEDSFTSEYYTGLYVTVSGAEALDAFTDAYFEKVTPVVTDLKDLGKERIDTRIEEIREELLATVTEEVTKEVTEKVTEEVEAAVKEEIEEAVAEAVEEAVTEAIQEEVRAEVEKAVREGIETEVRAQVEAAVRNEIASQTLSAVQAAVEAQIREATRSSLESTIRAMVMAQPGMFFGSLPSGMTPTDEMIDQVVTQLVEQRYEAACEQALAENYQAAVEAAYPAAYSQAIAANFDSAVSAAYATALEKAMAENYEKTVEEEYEKALETAMAENYEEAYASAYEEALQEAMEEKYESTVAEVSEEEIGKILPDKIREIYEEKEEEILSEADSFKWYVLDRDSVASYAEYKSATDQMKNIATIFPLFFFFVAALVCFTTMTRMVDEQRGLIGTYKALGYGKQTIALRYVLYALVAAFFGGTLGAWIGLKIFPLVIFNAWAIAYQMPAMVAADNLLLCILAVAGMTIVITAAAVFAVYKELVAMPSELMRPRAPKVGKTVFLEKIPFIWNRFSFTKKVTARNILRYKKRFIMTLLGVAGCTALLITGFGISDSVNDLITTQFDEIYRYDLTISVKGDLTDEERAEAISALESLKGPEERLFVTTESIKLNSKNDFGNEKEYVSTSLILTDEEEAIASFYGLRDPKHRQEEYRISEDGLYLSKTAADKLEVSIGDMLYLENADGEVREIRVTHIFEFYVRSLAFCRESYYESLYGETVEKNTLLANGEFSEEEQDRINKELSEVEGIQAITFMNLSTKSIRSMISALNLITIVLIVSSALLSFVVLYNLSNVNISERLREIATIKVLGFYHPEVNAYVFRETITISVIGSFIGMGAGILLHHMIMKMISLEGVTFGTYIAPQTYLYSFLLMIAFTVLVSIFVNRKLKKIPMVESLKSVE